MKQILLVNDLSGIGKVALSVALPIMACAQVESSLLPTVILSSHTGGFPDIYIDNYQEGMSHFIHQWQQLPLHFDGILTGYLKTPQQIQLLLNYKNNYMPQATLFVDPIMGDHGKLYQGFTQDFIQEMKQLCQQADVIIPNLTEASLLADYQIDINNYTINDLTTICQQLDVPHIIITGISLKEDEIGAFYYHNKQYHYFSNKKFDQNFFGTGDIFSTIVTACYLRGISFKKAIPLAINFIVKSLESTLQLKREIKYGVYYEPHLALLIQQINHLSQEDHNDIIN